MEELIQMLTELENSDVEAVQFLSERVYPPVEKIRNLLDQVLIAKDGDVNWENREKLQAAGWHSYAYERDSFGWLLGALVTRKGDIVFG